jgi:predicted RNA-binding Zn-ribbon protein involved in translation (DUF1610 family)
MGYKQTYQCLSCGITKVGINTRGKYCSNRCQANHRYQQDVDRWLNGISDGMKAGIRLGNSIRRWLLEQAEYKCSECGWNKPHPATGRPPLEIDHIDGNAENCRRDNLRVLCPNCHALTPTWKALNKGKASKQRLMYTKLARR